MNQMTTSHILSAHIYTVILWLLKFKFHVSKWVKYPQFTELAGCCFMSFYWTCSLQKVNTHYVANFICFSYKYKSTWLGWNCSLHISHGDSNGTAWNVFVTCFVCINVSVCKCVGERHVCIFVSLFNVKTDKIVSSVCLPCFGCMDFQNFACKIECIVHSFTKACTHKQFLCTYLHV